MFRMSPEDHRKHQERVGREQMKRDGGQPTPEKEKPVKRPNPPTEHSEQTAFVAWFRLKFPAVIVFAIANGGSRHPAEAVNLKKSGVLPGVPDLFIPEWKLWIEMKRQRGSVTSPEQVAMAEYLTGCGYGHFFTKGCDDAISQIKLWVNERAL